MHTTRIHTKQTKKSMREGMPGRDVQDCYYLVLLTVTWPAEPGTSTRVIPASRRKIKSRGIHVKPSRWQALFRESDELVEAESMLAGLLQTSMNMRDRVSVMLPLRWPHEFMEARGCQSNKVFEKTLFE